MRRKFAFSLALNDPDIKMEEFKQAVRAVENARKSRGGGR